MKQMNELSGQYFRVANELRAMAHATAGSSGISPRYVFPAVILYCTCVESYFNEQLTLSSIRIGDRDLLAKIDHLKYRAKPRDRYREIFRRYDPDDKGLDTNGDLYRNLLALIELRNAVTHYTPSFMGHVKWPARLQAALRGSKLSVLNASWTTNFSSIAVVDWSYVTTKDVIQRFNSMVGRSGTSFDPFSAPEEVFRWE